MTATSAPSPPAYFVAADAQVWCDTGGELLLLHVPSGIYYGLSSSGERVWRLVQEPRTAVELREALLEEYEVAPARCEADLIRLLGQLAAAGLVRVAEMRADPPGAPRAADAAARRGPYAEPSLLRLGDRRACLLWWVGLESVVSERRSGTRPDPAAAAAPPVQPPPGETLAGSGRPLAAREHTLELLTSCARARLAGADVERLRRLAAGVAEWDRVREVADGHGMLPLLYWHLHRHAADLLPPPALDALRREFMRNAIGTLELSGELQQVSTLFGAHGMLAVPYKGPTLAASVYGNVALRRRGDLDLLLHREDVPRARELLLERGYEERHELSAGAAEHLLRSKYHEILDRGSSPSATVELHWAFTSRDLNFGLDLEALVPRLGSTRLGGMVMPTFSIEDQLLILCVHGSRHRWKRLEWVASVAELLRGPAHVAWEELLERSAVLRSQRMLLLGIYLAHTLLDAPMPGELREVARRDRTLQRLTAQVRELLLRKTSESATRDARAPGALRFRVQLQERLSDKIRILGYHLTTPAVESWRVASFGGSAVPLHALYRPLDLLVKASRRAYHALLRSENGSADGR